MYYTKFENIRIRKSREKQKMLYLSKPIKFKKQTQSLNSNIKDKQISDQIKVIKQISKQSQQIKEQVECAKKNYKQKQQTCIIQYQQLVAAKAKIQKQILQMIIRKNRIQAFDDPSITEQQYETLKKYFQGYLEYKKSQFITKIGGLKNYRKAKLVYTNLQILRAIKPQIRSLVYFKILHFWSNDYPNQKMVLSIKKKPHEIYLLQAYTITNKYYTLKRECSEEQIRYIFQTQESEDVICQKNNPLQQLIILWQKEKLLLFEQYLEEEGNVNIIMQSFRKFQLKIHLQKQRRKMILFFRTTINNIFETRYNVKGYENLSLDVLIVIKDYNKVLVDYEKQIAKLKQRLTELENNDRQDEEKESKTSELKYIQKKYQQLSKNCMYDDFIKNRQSGYDHNYMESCRYIFNCETIKSYDSKFMFTIEDTELMKGIYIKQANIMQQFSHRMKQSRQIVINSTDFRDYFHEKFLICLQDHIIKNKQDINVQKRFGKRSAQIYDKNFNFDMIYQSSKKHQTTIAQTINKGKKIVKVIDFQSVKNLSQIVRIQSYCRMKINQIKYKEYLKSARRFKFSHSFLTSILLSVIIRKKKLIFFVQCLFLSSEGNRRHKNCLEYPEKYWGLADKFLIQDGHSIIQHCLVWQIEEQITKNFNKRIVEFELQQQRILQLKPEKTNLKLKKFFMMLMLKRKRKENIIYVKKVVRNLKKFIFMIRKSSIVHNIYEVFLFSLEQKYGRKITYQTIFLTATDLEIYLELSRKMKNIEDQFYISDHHFIRKPFFQKNHYRFIERFGCINVFAQQLQNQVELILGKLKNQENDYSIRATQANIDQKNLSKKSDHIKSFYLVDSIIPPRVLQINKYSQEVLIPEIQKKISQRNQELKQHFNSDLEGQQQIFYSLYKDEGKKNIEGIFCLILFIIKKKQGYETFKQIWAHEIKRKQLTESSWGLIFKIIAQWLVSTKKNSQNTYTAQELEITQKKSRYKFQF